jgi:acyl transferase domain-containing protein
MNLAQRLNEMTPLQRAVFALKETQARLDALEQKRTEPVAIVGMACRFPGGANDPESFWQLLCKGVDAIGEVPPERWNAEEFYDPNPAAPGKMNTRWGGFLERIDEFDSHFFGLSDVVAARIDPQHRILHELAWEALEDAGVPPCSLRGTKVGVFVGVALSEYGLLMSSDLSLANAHVAAGTSLCMAANRLSFTFGLHGPSIALDTACSSSLVAVHLACQSLRNGDCDSALVGAASLVLSPIGNVNLTKAGFSAPDGRVRAFDAAASGYVRSDGAGMVVLKPLSAAIKNQDPIYAVIRGSAVNQNGSSNGITAPSRAAQEQLLREAYVRARVAPGQVGFVESQGTGTRLGDAIEISALSAVLRQERPEGSRCVIGALKTNIGHLEAASGIASLMKAALALKHQQIPPNLHFQTPNPEIPFGTIPFRMPRKLEIWPSAGHPRFAGVSAFGFGGSNSHVVLEEVQPSQTESTNSSEAPHWFLPLSARGDDALQDLIRHYIEYLRNDPPAWRDVCHTAANRKDHHDNRIAVVADSSQQAIQLLERFLTGQSPADVFAGKRPYGRKLKIAFLFNDLVREQTLHILELREAVSSFATATRDIDSLCQKVLGWSLQTIRSDDSRWMDPLWTRSVTLVLQLALSAWWRHLGIEPDAVMGTGVGELTAAVAAGILTTEEALCLVSENRREPENASREPLNPRSSALPFYSCLDGKLHAGPDLDSAHWRTCLNRTHGMVAAQEGIASRSIDAFLDTGTALNFRGAPSVAGGMSEGLRRHSQSLEVLSALAALYAAGADFVWSRLPSANGRCVRVPAYPWQRKRLWAIGDRRVIPVPLNWSAPREDAARIEAAASDLTVTELRDRPQLAAPYIAPRTRLEESLARSWSEILQIRQIGVYDNFFELGGDSLQAMSLLNRLQEHVGEAVSALALFESQNINDLANFLLRQYPDAIARQYPGGMEIGSNGNGSEIPSSVAGVPLSPRNEVVAIPRLARASAAEDLLSRIDDLDDDEVELLLGSETIDDEVGV